MNDADGYLHWKYIVNCHGMTLLGFKDVYDRKILHTEFFKVQYIIIQAILGQKSMKKLWLLMKKYSVSRRLLTVKDNSHTDLRTSHTQFLRKGS